eukprot:CAMPEP_0175153116 /NCGR_PEP_ID=MMETSP0087-20121206/19534_1 /TAXON_ID=136419 /ORGANISM="Unknown Unknown, Strain D1" /LENGTH=383 /DNA_ID=CAMNT_0016439711 /DNA_START=45 /DNA_END=1196 /DNA_ORIENTATION=+
MADLEAVTPSKEVGVSHALLLYWRGQALETQHATYVQEAELLLAKSVKLEPWRVQAWNALGNVFWKKNDKRAAKNCFVAAVNQAKGQDSASLRNLSMILRSLADNRQGKEHATNVEESVNRAKQAIALDVKSADNWFVMGNAYLSQCFSLGTHDPKLLNSAFKAYLRSEELQGSSLNPDLYYNKGNIHKYNEEYMEALKCYTMASRLDPTLQCKKEIEQIPRLVAKLASLIANKNGLKAKKLDQLAEHLRTSMKKMKDTTTAVSLSELQEGGNKDKALMLKIIAPVHKDTDTPVSVLGLDSQSDMFVVSIYNVAPAYLDQLKLFSTMTVFDPHLRNIAVETAGGGKVSYMCVRTSNPASVFVDGQPTQQGVCAPAMAANETKV